jgi:hypothetical protein
MNLFIDEENRHAEYLGQFMDRQGIERAKATLNDTAFRFLRKLMGIELSIRVLVIAETIALTYYLCLKEATRSKQLALICERMLSDERAHVVFQMQHIHEMNFRKHPLSAIWCDVFHFLLLAATLVAVWLEHRQVLTIKYSFTSFFRKVWRDFCFAARRGQNRAFCELRKRGEIRRRAVA